MLPDGVDDVALHHLHVIDVVEQAQGGRIDHAADLQAPGRAVALLVGVIDLAVEQLQQQGNAGRLRARDDCAQGFRTDLRAGLVVEAVAAAN